jgi:hypothetical protein
VAFLGGNEQDLVCGRKMYPCSKCACLVAKDRDMHMLNHGKCKKPTSQASSDPEAVALNTGVSTCIIIVVQYLARHERAAQDLVEGIRILHIFKLCMPLPEPKP